MELTNCLTRLGPDDLARFLSCFTSDVYYDDSFLGVHEGHEGLTRLFDAIYRDGADYQWQFFDLVITGETGYARYILCYTSTMPGSQGKDVLLEGVSMVKLRGGLISEYREVTDMGPALAQLDYPPARIRRILDRKASTLRKKYGPAATRKPF